jgi:hypothetical protein
MLLQEIIDWSSWHDVVDWWSSLSATEQLVLGIFGIIIGVAITVLVCIGVFYLLKYLFIGIAYLLKYIFKGIAWIFQKLGELFAALFKAIKPEEEKVVETHEKSAEVERSVVALPQKVKHTLENEVTQNNLFCPECGMKFTNMTSDKLNSNGKAFCVYCGTGLHITVNPASMQTVHQAIPKDYSNYR